MGAGGPGRSLSSFLVACRPRSRALDGRDTTGGRTPDARDGRSTVGLVGWVLAPGRAEGESPGPRPVPLGPSSLPASGLVSRAPVPPRVDGLLQHAEVRGQDQRARVVAVGVAPAAVPPPAFRAPRGRTQGWDGAAKARLFYRRRHRPSPAALCCRGRHIARR